MDILKQMIFRLEIIDLWKEIVEMDKYDLTEVWNGLDTVCEDVEKLLNKLSSMSGLPDELQQEINNLDISSISNLKHHIGKILDDRISRQSGNFTLHSPRQPFNFKWNDTFISGRSLVDMFTINPDATKEIKLCLECLNINKFTLYKIDSDKLDDESTKIKNETIKRFQNDFINCK